MKKLFLTCLAVITIAGCNLNQPASQSASPSETQSLPSTSGNFQLKQQVITVEIADTPAKRIQGLSGRTEIGADGMLFIFEQPLQPGFWMKDMKFDLDFIWIRDGKVVEVMTNIPKPSDNALESELPSYFPSTLIDSMLEVPAGFADQLGVQVGDNAQLLTK